MQIRCHPVAENFVMTLILLEKKKNLAFAYRSYIV